MRKENEKFSISVDGKEAAILCTNRNIAEELKLWLEDQSVSLEEFVTFLNRIGIDTPVEISASEEEPRCREKMLSCFCINSHQFVTLSLDMSEIGVTRGEKTDFYSLDYAFKWTHCLIKRDRITVEDWPELMTTTRSHAATRDVFIGEKFTLRVDFRFYKDTPEEVICRNMNEIDEFLLTMEDYSDIQYVYERVSEYLGLKNAIKECSEVLISYNEKLNYVSAPMVPISEMEHYIVEVDFYGIPRERMHYRDGKCIEFTVSKDGVTCQEFGNGTVYVLGKSFALSFNSNTDYRCIMHFGKLKEVIATIRKEPDYNRMVMEILAKYGQKVEVTEVTPMPQEDLSYYTGEEIKKGNVTLRYNMKNKSSSWYLSIGQHMLAVEYEFYQATCISENNKEKVKDYLLNLEDYSNVQDIYDGVSECLGLTNAAEECADVLISYNEYVEYMPVPMAMPKEWVNSEVLSVIFYGMPKERIHYRKGKSVEFATTKNGCTGYISNVITYFLRKNAYLLYNLKSKEACYAVYGTAKEVSETELWFNVEDFRDLSLKLD